MYYCIRAMCANKSVGNEKVQPEMDGDGCYLWLIRLTKYAYYVVC